MRIRKQLRSRAEKLTAKTKLGRLLNSAAAEEDLLAAWSPSPDF